MEDNKSTFLKGISVQTIITVILGLLELIVFAIMSRLLTKEDFGYFATLTGIVSIFTSITEAGLGAAIIQKKDATFSFVSTAFSLSWIMGALGTLLMFILAPTIATTIADEHLCIPLRIMSLNIFLACTASVGRSLLMRNLKFKSYGSFEVLSYVFSSSLGITLAFLGCGLYAIMAVSISNFILLNIILYTRGVKLPKLKIVKGEIGGIFSFGGWLTLSVVVNQITQQLDKLLLPKWLSVSALGAYNRPAGFLSTVTGKINSIFDTVLFPMLSKIQNDTNRVQGIFVRAVGLLNSFSSILFCIFFFNAHLIVNIFFGKNWLELVPVFKVISLYVIFNIDNRLVDCFFRSLNLVRMGFFLRVLSAFITFTFLYFGCKFGIMGVAVALVAANISTVFIKIGSLIFKIKASPIKVLKSFIIACKPMVIPILIGSLYIYIGNQSITFDILQAVIMGIAIIIEFCVFPSLVSEEYKMTIYPTVSKYLHKLKIK